MVYNKNYIAKIYTVLLEDLHCLFTLKNSAKTSLSDRPIISVTHLRRHKQFL